MAGCRKLAVFGSISPAEEEGAEDAISPGETPHCFQTEGKKTHTTHGKCGEIRINKVMAQITVAYIEKRPANISYKVYSYIKISVFL